MFVAARRRCPRDRPHEMMFTAMASSPDIRDPVWVAERLESGDTVAAIAEVAGVSRQTASSWLKRHGLSATKQPLRRPSVEQMAADYERFGSIRPMATAYGISPSVMRTWLFEAGVELNPAGSSGGRPRLDVDLDEAKRLRRDGRTLTDIATRLGVSYETLRRRLEG